ncbi:TPA: hypothetical protein DCE37_02195 [Candidatus Latescibacteria bacterium]|nr:hypothetical protein [Candidatus Latescibacterota bacterium]
MIVTGGDEEGERVVAIHRAFDPAQPSDDAVRITVKAPDPDLEVLAVAAEPGFGFVECRVTLVRVALNEPGSGGEALPDLLVKPAIEIDPLVCLQVVGLNRIRISIRMVGVGASGSGGRQYRRHSHECDTACFDCGHPYLGLTQTPKDIV